MKKQNINLVRLLLNRGADPTKGIPLLGPSGDPNTEIIELLLEHGANPNVQDFTGRTPLHEAVRYENFYLVKLLLNYGAKTNIKTNSYSFTRPSRYTLFIGRPYIAKYIDEYESILKNI